MPLEKLNDEQMEILLDFADRCRYLCFGRTPKNKDDEIIAYKEWKELSRDLNYAGNLPWKSGKEWKMYWSELKNRTKAKLGNAKRRSKFTGAPMKLNLNCWEQRILELAEIVANEPRGHQPYQEGSDITISLPEEGACQPKFESTPNTSQNSINDGNPQVQPLDMSNSTQAPVDVSQLVSFGTQITMKSPVKKTPGPKKSLNTTQNIHLPSPQVVPPQYTMNGGPMLPNPPTATNFSSSAQKINTPTVEVPLILPEAGSGLSELSDAVQALARANVSIADALRALSGRVNSNK